MLNIERILKVIGNPPDHVYGPSDDSFLMIEALSKLSLCGKEVLDLGTGSGLLGLTCADLGAQVTISDVDNSALGFAKAAAHKLELIVKAKESDLFSNVASQFDVVLFNPPYLPSDTNIDRTVDGGPEGRALIDRFLSELPSHLKPEGFALLLVSSLNDLHSIVKNHPEFSFSVTAKRRLFFEELRVLLCRFRDLS